MLADPQLGAYPSYAARLTGAFRACGIESLLFNSASRDGNYSLREIRKAQPWGDPSRHRLATAGPAAGG